MEARLGEQSEQGRPGEWGREILIVDNDDRIVELVSWFLLKRGFGVRKAENFQKARTLLAEKPVDLLLSDIDLGVENALDVLPQMHAEGVLPPTLVFSGYLDAQAHERLMALGPVVGTLAKPVEFQVLEARVVEHFQSLKGEGGPFGSDWIPRPEVQGGATPANPRSEDVGDGWVEIVPREPGI